MIALIGIISDRHREEERDHDDRFALDAQRTRLDPARSNLPACLLRFRPIMMTTWRQCSARCRSRRIGEGSELRRPSGISIVGGLLVSQMLTLFTTPVIYLYLDRFKHRIAEQGVARGSLRKLSRCPA